MYLLRLDIIRCKVVPASGKEGIRGVFSLGGWKKSRG